MGRVLGANATVAKAFYFTQCTMWPGMFSYTQKSVYKICGAVKNNQESSSL